MLARFASALVRLSFLALLGGPPHISSAPFSRAEWLDPGRAGSVLWIRNPSDRALSIDVLSVRTLGFQAFGEVAFKAGPRRMRFAVKGDPRNRWARLVPTDGARMRVRARDSLMLSGFECGARLRAGQGRKKTAEEFVLDLKAVDSRGDTALVKIVQLAPQYRIPDDPARADTGPEEP